MKKKEGFRCWHTSEFLAKNPKSEAANWDDAKLDQVFLRVRQIAKKSGIKVVLFAVPKRDYDDAVPPDLRRQSGNFITLGQSAICLIVFWVGVVNSGTCR